MKKSFTFFIFLLSFISVSAQEKLGVANSNYSSVNSIYLNPSSSVDSRTLFQFNLVGLNVFAMNNIAYIPNFSVWDAKNGNVQNPEYSTFGFKKFAYAKAEVNAPSFVLSYGEIGAGFFIRGRVEASVNNVPTDIAQMLVQQKIDTTKLFAINAKNTRVAEMAWVEYGVNFGKMTFKHSKTMITLGGNAKYITGVNVGYANIYRLNAQVNDQQFDISNVRAKVRYNTPEWKAGSGFGVDIGITYKKMLNFVDTYYSNSPKSGCKYVDYRYKLGLSLLDVGAVRFSKNTFKGDIAGSATINDFKNGNIDSTMRADFHVSTQTNLPIWARLPTAFSLQADLNLTHHFYLNATLIQGITTARMVGVQHSNLLSVTPRFETRNFEFAMPITMYRYIYPQLGCAIRFRTFVLGMDNVMPLIAKTSTFGANIYFNLGISIFKNSACKVSRSRYTPTKKSYEGYTFLSLRGKPKHSILGDGKGAAPGGDAMSSKNRLKASKKAGKKRRNRNTQKL
jgi:hypothetical protein